MDYDSTILSRSYCSYIYRVVSSFTMNNLNMFEHLLHRASYFSFSDRFLIRMSSAGSVRIIDSMLMQIRLPLQGFTLKNIFISLASFYLPIYSLSSFTKRQESFSLAYYFIYVKVPLSFFKKSSMVVFPFEIKLGNLIVYSLISHV